MSQERDFEGRWADQGRDAHLHIRLTASEQGMIRAMAAERGQTVTAYVIGAVKRDYMRTERMTAAAEALGVDPERIGRRTQTARVRTRG